MICAWLECLHPNPHNTPSIFCPEHEEVGVQALQEELAVKRKAGYA